MGYVSARGGLDAIQAAERLVRRLRLVSDSTWLEEDQILDKLRMLVDRVMSEAGLWDPRLAAAAIRQSEGDVTEAVHLLRAYRSTLPRFAYSEPSDADDIRVRRRIVPAFQRVPGDQLLGRSVDYTARFLERQSDDDAREEAEKLRAEHATAIGGTATNDGGTATNDGGTATNDGDAARTPRRLIELLREMDLLVDRRSVGDPEPFDITRVPARPPAPRSALLSSMSRADTGALVNQWYRNILGPDGYLHEVTLGEVRHGDLEVVVAHPVSGEAVSVAEVRVTEVEAIEDLDEIGEDRTRFDVGYGLCFGHNERKAIAMANLDIACHRDAGRTQLEQSLLLTTDALDSAGFLEHLKLPHYVTFRSMIERKIAVRKARRQHDA
jgi:alpha-D-ribose 1-methylphosphonate 5-triphosphate synthase subunit PhnI